MKIEIKHIHNVNHADFVLEDHKVNFIVGPSGSGKSSIAKAIVVEEDELEIYKSVYGGTPSITINGTKNYDRSGFVQFSDSYRIECLVARKANTSIYEVFVGDVNDYLIYDKELNLLLVSFEHHKEKLNDFFTHMDQIKKDIFNSIKVKGSRKGNLEKFESSVIGISDSSRAKLRNSHQERLQWMKEAIDKKYIDENNSFCPFCNKKLGKRLLDFTSLINSIDPKSLQKLKDSEDILRSLGIEDINFYNLNDLKKVKSKIADLITVEMEISSILQNLEIIRFADINLIISIEKFKLSKLTTSMFVELEADIMKINDKIIDLKKAYGVFINHSKSKIRKSEEKLNSFLLKFGIPYEFKLVQIDNKSTVANYQLIHISDLEKSERTCGLSSGEQNVVALLLFLLGNKRKNIIIDDPASSFDENKRILIYQAIIDLFDKRTTLVLSHDFIFAKFASYDVYKKRNLNNLGSIKYFENNYYESSVLLKNIDFNDFKVIDEHVKNHLLIPKIPYMSKIIGLRLYYETKKKRVGNDVIYGYLSLILHQEENLFDALDSLYIHFNKSEQEIIDMINQNFPKLPLERFNGQSFCDSDEMTLFEKLIYRREQLRKSRGGLKHIKDQISNIFHLNEAHVLQVDPYQFNYFPKALIDYVNKSE